ncbi:hypothetical protein OC861_003251 [Tilletia horrida]|nr:hypothetical protein OC861_003251 [Tilletia horrida]
METSQRRRRSKRKRQRRQSQQQHQQQQRRQMLPVVLLLLIAGAGAHAQSTSTTGPSSLRWGAASTQLNGVLLVHGGKATTNQGYTYTSAPDSSDLLLLNLTQGFALDSPPWQQQQVNTSSSSSTPPTASFHTISPLSGSQFILFGGQDSTSPTPSGNDSLYLLDLSNPVTPAWTAASTAHPSWNQPMRRMLHSAPSDPVSQSLYILGGEKADGSNLPTQELWSWSASSPVFSQQIPPPPVNIVDGAAPLLADGTIVLIGGLSATSSPALSPMNTITSYNPSSRTWTSTSVASPQGNTSFPAPRRAHVAVPLPDNRIFVHGGANADLSQAMSDAWILDWSASPPSWFPVSSSSPSSSTNGPSARFAHTAVSYGNNIVLAYGWSGNNPAETSLWVWDGTGAKVDASSSSVQGGFWIGTGTGSGADQGVSSGGGGTTAAASSASYVPDPNAQAQSNGLGLHSPASSGSNPSSSGNNNQTPSGNDPSSTTSKSHHNPTSSHPNPATDGQGSTPAAAKAGIVIGALMGLGLAAGAGYYAYRAYQAHHHPYNRGGGYGKAALLGHGSTAGWSDDDGYSGARNLANSGSGGMGGLWAAAAGGVAATAGGLLMGSAGRKRRRDEAMDDHEQLMLEKGSYQRLNNLGEGGGGGGRKFSNTGADAGSPASFQQLQQGRFGDRGLPPIGPRGPKALSRNEYYSAALEADAAAQATVGYDRSEMHRSDGSMGTGGVIPMAGATNAASLAAAQAGVKAGVRDKIARLVGAARQSGEGLGGATGAAGGAAATTVMMDRGRTSGGFSRPGGPRSYGRLDILADEDADEEVLRRKYPRQYGAARHMVDPFADSNGRGLDEIDDDEVGEVVTARRTVLGGYGELKSTMEEEDEEDEVLGPRRELADSHRYAEPAYQDRISSEDHKDEYTVSPFEDGQGDRKTSVSVKPILNFRGATLAGAGGAGEVLAARDSTDSARQAARVQSSTQQQQQPSLFSNVLNMPASQSGGGVGWAADVGNGEDSRRAGGADREDSKSPLMRRSGTWWDRFMATSFLDRNSSSNGNMPVHDALRDPRKLNESLTSIGGDSLHDPFADDHRAGDAGRDVDEHGRPTLSRLNVAADGAVGAALAGPASARPQGGSAKLNRSLSSLQSARTATSSVLEAQLAGMDVIQRTHTLSSSRGGMSSASPSEDGSSIATPLSRGSSLREQHAQRRGAGAADLASVAEDGDTSMRFWDGNPWNRLRDGDDGDVNEQVGDCSADIVDQRGDGGGAAVAADPSDPTAFGVQLRKSPHRSDSKLLVRSPSGAPSITPSLTKRSRQNRQLTSPISPLLTHTPPAPIHGSVRERVEALERKYSADEMSLQSRSTGGATTGAQSDSLYAPTMTATTAPSSSSSHVSPVVTPIKGGASSASSSRARTRSSSPTRMEAAAASRKPMSVFSAATSGEESSGSNGQASGSRIRTTVGLVPRAQLFVANPDDR